MSLATWGGVTDSLVAIFRFRVSILSVTRCLRVFQMVFVQKRRLSIFSRLIMARSQKWSDLRSPISKFRDACFIYTVTYINRWSVQGDQSFGVAMTSIQTFSEVRSLDVTCHLMTWPWVTWVWNFHNMCEKDVWTGVPKMRRGVSLFFRYLLKT